MSDIPDDLRSEARRRSGTVLTTRLSASRVQELIERAMLDERERCARVAFGFRTRGELQKEAAHGIGLAIQSGAR